jgi:hypothetical protein
VLEAHWRSPAQAATHIGITLDELARLVADARIRAHQLPSGALIFSTVDLDALPVLVQASEAAELITNLFTKDKTMHQVAIEMPTPAVASIDARQIFQKLEELITETRREASAVVAKWLDIDAAVTCFGAPPKTIKEWAKGGFVRKSKLGPSFQSKTLYNADDIDAVLNRIAVGKSPVVALREVG